MDVLDSGTLEIRDRTTRGLLTDDATAAQDRLLDWSDDERVPTSLTLTMPEQLRSGLLGGHRRRQEDKTKDYVAEPKPSGYRAIHIYTRYHGRRIEVQFRTPGQTSGPSSSKL